MLEHSGAEVAQRRMSPLPVVELLDVVEELGARRRPRLPRGVVDEFDLQRGKEALGDRVVPAIAPAAHAAHDPMLSQELLVVPAGVLGGFNWSSQHRAERGGDDDDTEATFATSRA